MGRRWNCISGGFLTLPEDVITIWADNGYGKNGIEKTGKPQSQSAGAASRRIEGWEPWNVLSRLFYDLQAANHIIMLPNSMEFVEKN